MKRQVVERYETDCGELVFLGTTDNAPSGQYVRAELADDLLVALVNLFDFAGIDLNVPLRHPVMRNAMQAICNACGSGSQTQPKENE